MAAPVHVVTTLPELLATGRGSARPAIECGIRTFTRSDVDARVERLARRLVRAGVAPGVLVGVAMPPSPEQIFSVLAVLRAGGAFLLLDPALPASRRQELVDEAGVGMVLGADEHVTRAPDPELLDVATVFCTSGSTGRPKVVPLRHSSILNFAYATIERIELGADDVVLGLANPSFDAWLLELVLPLATGATLRLCEGEERLDGLARARALDGVTVFLDTPTRLRNLLEAGWWPLHPIKVLSAGEPLLPDLVVALLARGCRVYNVYGPTEVCVCSNVGEIVDATGPIPVGPPLHGVDVWLDGEEIIVGGEGVSRGYLRRPGLSAGRFVDGHYRTGDIGRIEGGLLYCLGRVDRQVKVRGQRIEPGEVEARIRAWPGVTGCVVYLLDGQLAAAIVGRVELAALQASLRETLPPAMVPATWQLVDQLPQTATGKVDVRAIVEASPAGPTPMCALFDELLGRTGTMPDDDFFLVGGHSMLAARLSLLVQRRLGRHLGIGEIFQLRTPARLDARLDRPELVPIPAVDRSGPLPQSYEQARIWTHTALEPEDALYELRFHIDIEGECEPERIRAALDTLVARHEALRTTLHEGIQRVHAPYAVAFGDGPLDIGSLPGLRARLDGSRLELRVHHAVFDGWSAVVLLDELADALAGTLAPAPTLFPADVAAWQRARNLDDAPIIERWRHRLAGLTPAPRQPTAGSDAHVRPVRISSTERIRELARGRTVHTVLAAAWAAQLQRWLGGDGVVIATLSANRTRPELERMIGFFANTTLLPLRWPASGRFEDLVDQVQVRMAEGMADAELPFDRLVAGLRPARSGDLQPLARAFFAMAEPPQTRAAGDLRLTLHEVPAARSPFDLVLELCDRGDSIDGRLLARSAVYSRAQVDAMGAELDAWDLELAQPRPTLRTPPLRRPRPGALSTLPLPALLPAGEPAIRTGPALEQPRGRLLDLLGRGHHVFISNEISGAELQRRAERVAGGLAARANPGDIVALRLPEPEDFVVAFWGCVRAGLVPAPGGATGLVVDAAVLATLDGPPPPIPEPGGVVLMLSTAGSTGAPKPVPHTDAEVLAFCASYAAGLDLHAGDNFLNVLGLDHVAPLFMSHLITMWLDATEVQVAAHRWLATPRLWLDLASRYRATAAVAPSFAWKLIADSADGVWDLSSMRAALNGGETVSPSVAWRLIERLAPSGFAPDALRPGWGMSETCSCAVVGRGLVLDEGQVGLGEPLPGVELQIVDEAGRTLAEGEVGRLLVRGPTVAGGWFDTGDLGRIGPAGLVLTGRARDVVVIHGTKVPLTEVEAVAEGFAFTAPVADGEAGLGLVVVGDAERAADRVAERFGARPRWLASVAPEDVPRGVGGKVDRARLAALAHEVAEEGRLPVVATRTSWEPSAAEGGPATFVDGRGWTLADVALPPGDVVLRLSGVARVYPEDPLDPVQSAVAGVAWCIGRARGTRVTVVDGGDSGAEPLVAWRHGRRLVPRALPVDLEVGARRLPGRPGWVLIGGRGGVGSRLAVEGPVLRIGRGETVPADFPVGTVVLLVPGALRDDGVQAAVDAAIERATRAVELARGARLLSIGSVLGSTGAAGLAAYVAADRATDALITAAGGLHLRTPAWRDTGLRRGYLGADALDPEAAALAVLAAIDRVLPPDTLVVPEVRDEVRAPVQAASPRESEVVRIFAEVLGVETVDPTRGFFELGGTSLLLARLQARLGERLGRKLTLVELFQSPTPRAMAALFDGTDAPVDPGDRAAQQRAAFARAAARRGRT